MKKVLIVEQARKLLIALWKYALITLPMPAMLQPNQIMLQRWRSATGCASTIACTARAPGRKTVLANNGEVVEIRALSEEGMVVRNDTGAEGVVARRKIPAARIPRCASATATR